jgi:hypothetical protein
MKQKTSYPDHPELLECILQEIRDTPMEAYDARIARYEQETLATEVSRQQTMETILPLQELIAKLG